MTTTNDKMTPQQLLIPLSIITLSLLLFFAFQMTQVLKERGALKQNLANIQTPLEQGQKLTQQFGGLVTGTQKLALEGNVIAKDFVERLKKIGVIMAPPANAEKPASPMAPVPAASEVPEKGPVKP